MSVARHPIPETAIAPMAGGDRVGRRAWCRQAASAVVGGAAPWALSATPRVIRFAHVVAPDTPKGRMVAHFQRLVEQRSGGRWRVAVYPASELYGDEDEMEALRLGAVEMLAPSLSKFGLVGLAHFEVFDLPFLFDGLASVHRITQGALGQELLRDLGRQHMVGLGFLDNGFKHMSGHRPLERPSDYAGLRMRIQASRVLAAQMRALGAQPVVLPFGETAKALRLGVVAGTENPLSNFWTQGLASVQGHLTLTQHGYLGYAVVANARFWGGLSGADRHLLSAAMGEALAQGNRSAAAQERQAWLNLQRLPGLAVHRVSDERRAALRRAVWPVHRDFQQRVDASWWRAVQQALAST